MKKFFRRLGGVWGLYANGLLGLLAAMFGWWLGSVIYNWRDSRRWLKKFLSTHTELKIKSIILVPIVAACVYRNGWRGLIASIVGIAVGEFICRRFLFKKR